MFQLTKTEFDNLKSKIAISSWGEEERSLMFLRNTKFDKEFYFKHIDINFFCLKFLSIRKCAKNFCTFRNSHELF